ncbi:EAL domain-containing protein [Peribacillus deserti]|uniref:EAL domain-containing protein n=1 Tax=Peribacillus deserti TaxID=673318 RepID=A0A2N5M9V0_9BACI|nr:EAL domain-containing protein [Peribacillus deserti]PLT31129.1 EAL domain-containing protein [Peribacillus deserti]
MINNKIIDCLNYLSFLKSNRKLLYLEFKQNQELKRLIEPTAIQTVFQPILSLHTGGTVGYEILNRPPKTSLFPTTEKFYDFVGKSKDVMEVEYFLRDISLERYSEQARSFTAPTSNLLFINIQPQLLENPLYRSGKTLELLSKHGLSPKQIVLELTEKDAVIDYNSFVKVIKHYRQQGYRIAVDDAGTGYNSLKTLVYVKPEFIKLDKSLIRDIDKHSGQQQLVELLLDFALQSNTQVIAEGIENLAELEYLQKLGVHLGQGYALGKPLPILKEGTIPTSKLRTLYYA